MFVLIGMGACSKESYDVKTITEDYQLQKVWDDQTEENQQRHFTINSNNDIIVTKKYGSELNLLDGKTGELKWTWNDWDELNIAFQSFPIYNNVVMLAGTKSVCAVDALTGHTVWKFAQDTLSFALDNNYSCPAHLSEKGYYYVPCFLTDGTDELYFYKTQYNNPTWERVFFISDSTVTQTHFSVKDITTAQKRNGDGVIVVAMNDVNENYYWVACYNETQKRMDWVLNMPTINRAFNDARIFIKNDYVVFLTDEEIYGLNVDSGSVVWNTLRLEKECSNALVHNNHLILQSAHSSIEAIDIQTGQKDWSGFLVDGKTLDFNIPANSFSIRQNVLFVTTGYNLFGFDPVSGKKLLVKDVEYFTSQNAELSTQNRLLYLQNAKKLTCYKLPESIK